MSDGTCLDQCHSNKHCPEGQVCFSDGSCKHSCLKNGTIDKTGCPDGQYCHLDHKVCHDICTCDESCHDGYKCYNKACYKLCDSSSNCSDEQYCTG